jgi:hypothetical protein
VSGPLVVITLAPLARRADIHLLADSHEQERLALYALRSERPLTEAVIVWLLDELLADDDEEAA